jgi:hypothetical protein
VIDRKAKSINKDLLFQNPSNDTNIEAIKVLALDEKNQARLAIIRDRTWISVLDIKKQKCYRLFESTFNLDNNRIYNFDLMVNDATAVIHALEFKN